MISKLCRNTIHLSVFLCFLVLGRNKGNHSSRHSSLVPSKITLAWSILIYEGKLSGKTSRFVLVTLLVFQQDSKTLSNLIHNYSLLSHLYASDQSCIYLLHVSQHENLIAAKNPHVWCTIGYLIYIFSRHSALVAHGQLISWGFCLPLFPHCKISVSSRNCS